MTGLGSTGSKALFAAAMFSLLAPAVLPQAAHPVTGRPIAPVMGMDGADWLERAERDSEEAPDLALDALDIKPGMTIADVGAGVGYLTVRMAKRVGPEGKIYANDIQPGMIERLRRQLAEKRLTNVELVLGTETDPRLPPNAIDLVLLVDVYHEFSRPREMLEKIRVALKPDGRLVLFEYKKEDPTVPIREEHKMSVAEVKTELEAEGFRLDKVRSNLPRQHILVFRKNLM